MIKFQPSRVGDEVSGVVVRVESAASEYVQSYPVLTLLEGDTEIEVHASHVDLRRQLVGVSVGEYVSIRFEGKKPLSNPLLYQFFYSVEMLDTSVGEP